MKTKQTSKSHELTRRDFIRTSVVGAAALATGTNRIFAGGSDELRVGLVGCGRRGTGAIKDCISSSKGVVLVAMGDLFQDQLDKSLAELKKDIPDNLKVTKDTCFTGFDAYQKVIGCDVDLVILATPPNFRSIHLKAAVEAGKHVFMEKPVAVDPVGVRSVLTSSELAKQKKLAIVAGTQRRHQPHYVEIIKRIHRGDIGKIVSAQCYWIGDYNYYTAVMRQPGWSDMEWQCRNWNYFTWLSGDHIVEQHVHNIDVINWAIGSHPVKCIGMGGRQQRIGPEYGHIFDHFAVEFEYPNGARVTSMCRQMDKCSSRVSENIVGNKGSANTNGSTGLIEGEISYQYDGPAINPYVKEHTDLIESIRNGEPLNEGKNVAESTMTAIMGRMSAYTGRALNWEWAMNASKLDLSPAKYEFGVLPVTHVAVPGTMMLV